VFVVGAGWFLLEGGLECFHYAHRRANGRQLLCGALSF
jgi:hypothetical protein